MPSLKQIEANRRNAKQSTGPRSAEGKAVSRWNALKTGIDAESHAALPYEEAGNLEALTAEYYDSFSPETPEQRCLVDALISDEWSLRRFRAIEGQAITEHQEDSIGARNSLVDAYRWSDNSFLRLQRRIDSTRRSYLRTLDALRKLQAEPPRERPARIPPATAEPLPPQPLAPAIGFVPSLSVARPPAGPSALMAAIFAGMGRVPAGHFERDVARSPRAASVIMRPARAPGFVGIRQ